MMSFFPPATNATKAACCAAVRVLVLQAIAVLATLSAAVSNGAKLAALTAAGVMGAKVKAPSAGSTTGSTGNGAPDHEPTPAQEPADDPAPPTTGQG